MTAPREPESRERWDGLTPRFDLPWEKRPLHVRQFYLGIPGMENASAWPMQEEVIDHIVALHNASLASTVAAHKGSA